MIKPVNILVIEPSAIIRRGIVALIEDAEFSNIMVTQSPDVSSAFSSSSLLSVPDVVIINNTIFGSVAPAELKRESSNDALIVIALQTTITEQNTLNSYDSVISILDAPNIIKNKILAQITPNEDEQQNQKKELSGREKEIIVCVVKGLTNKQIAETLYISTHTVIAHRRNIASKLQIHSTAGLTIFAIVNKLVDLSDIENSDSI